MLSAAGFSSVLLLDGRKMDVSRHQFEDSAASRVSAMVAASLQKGTTWAVGWKDERVERGETRGTVWVREGSGVGSGRVSPPLHFKPGDIVYPFISGQLEDAQSFVELRLIINLVDGDGKVDFSPSAVFSFAISSGAQNFSLAPLATASARLGVAPRTFYETGALSPPSLPSAHPARLAASRPIVRLAPPPIYTAAPPSLSSTSNSPTGSVFLQTMHSPQPLPLISTPNTHVLEQALKNERALLQKLKTEGESASFYEHAVASLYARLSSRQLVAYLDHRLSTETLSATMRVSVALARQEAIERIETEDRIAISHELRQLLSAAASASVSKSM